MKPYNTLTKEEKEKIIKYNNERHHRLKAEIKEGIFDAVIKEKNLTPEQGAELRKKYMNSCKGPIALIKALIKEFGPMKDPKITIPKRKPRKKNAKSIELAKLVETKLTI